jgi:predicted DNA-binding protein YlxM (UPF0122 family)
MECYGKFYNKQTECKTCQHRKWCADAGEPELLTDKMTSLNGFATGAEEELSLYALGSKPIRKGRPVYTKEDLFEVISFFLALDWQTLEMLEEKLNHPEIKFTDMGRQRKISKQAVHKFIKSRCEMFPELEPFLRNRKNRIVNKPNETFMEAVCRIKKTTYETKSKKPESACPSSKNLTSLTRNLDLSRLSICKGAEFSNKS